MVEDLINHAQRITFYIKKSYIISKTNPYFCCYSMRMEFSDSVLACCSKSYPYFFQQMM